MNGFITYLPFIILFIFFVKDALQYVDYQKSTMALKTKDYQFYLFINHIPFLIIVLLSIIINRSFLINPTYAWVMLGVHFLLRIFATYFVYLNLERVAEQKQKEFKEEIDKSLTYIDRK